MIQTTKSKKFKCFQFRNPISFPATFKTNATFPLPSLSPHYFHSHTASQVSHLLIFLAILVFPSAATSFPDTSLLPHLPHFLVISAISYIFPIFPYPPLQLFSLYPSYAICFAYNFACNFPSRFHCSQVPFFCSGYRQILSLPGPSGCDSLSDYTAMFILIFPFMGTLEARLNEQLTPLALVQPPPEVAKLSGNTHHSIETLVVVLAVITIGAVIAGIIARLCGGRHFGGNGEHDIEGWVESRCRSCIDGGLPAPPPPPEKPKPAEAADAKPAAEEVKK